MQTNKRKIINDPVYGFMTLDYDLLYDIVSHPYFQRLQRIKQLGLSYLVYPGAMHTRFGHTLGATYLMGLAIDVLKNKEVPIDNDEALEQLVFPRIIAISKVALEENDKPYREFSNDVNAFRNKLGGYSFCDKKDWTKPLKYYIQIS